MSEEEHLMSEEEVRFLKGQITGIFKSWWSMVGMVVEGDSLQERKAPCYPGEDSWIWGEIQPEIQLSGAG